MFFKVAVMRMNALGVPPDQAVFYLASDDQRARKAGRVAHGSTFRLFV